MNVIGQIGGRTATVMQVIRARVASRTLVAGDRLPSIRALAAETGVSPSTVVEAYDRLVAEGVIRARRGSGFYVCATALPPLALAQEIVSRGLDAELSVDERLFAYTPYQHSESAVIQQESVRLFKALGHDDYLTYALAHRDIIARFGRFPLRNAALGRTSTPEELAYMKEREGKAY